MAMSAPASAVAVVASDDGGDRWIGGSSNGGVGDGDCVGGAGGGGGEIDGDGDGRWAALLWQVDTRSCFTCFVQIRTHAGWRGWVCMRA